MGTLRYLHLDVFTNRKFEGNQLAVFLDANELSDGMMQTLAREMNFAESTFVMPADQPDTDVRMRIFTPTVELPMAGHPTIGSTFALAHEGIILQGIRRFVFGLGVGPTPVELTWGGGELSFAWMDQLAPVFREPAAPRADILRAVGADPKAVAATNLPLQEVSCGVPYILVPVSTRAAVDAVQPDTAGMQRLPSAFGRAPVGVLLFSLEKVEAAVTAYSRMFVYSAGVVEDPATGSAAGPLGCYLAQHGLVPPDRWNDMVSLQGVAMKRPSRLHMRITRNSDGARVQVGGEAVLVGEGTIEI